MKRLEMPLSACKYNIFNTNFHDFDCKNHCFSPPFFVQRSIIRPVVVKCLENRVVILAADVFAGTPRRKLTEQHFTSPAFSMKHQSFEYKKHRF